MEWDMKISIDVPPILFSILWHWKKSYKKQHRKQSFICSDNFANLYYKEERKVVLAWKILMVEGEPEFHGVLTESDMTEATGGSHREQWQPLQCSCLEQKSRERGACRLPCIWVEMRLITYNILQTLDTQSTLEMIICKKSYGKHAI